MKYPKLCEYKKCKVKLGCDMSCRCQCHGHPAPHPDFQKKMDEEFIDNIWEWLDYDGYDTVKLKAALNSRDKALLERVIGEVEKIDLFPNMSAVGLRRKVLSIIKGIIQ